ncbi:DUF1573 domain-containing protein [Bernardetia sp.]|uniref:DUF1573 domain-containing protein n=1 Tax=Bernardetia sp. TaxID=1937974 RepID=UPI0025BB1AF2|nr:DUF1573 domain-containing protein [Bernardetia sp.]
MNKIIGTFLIFGMSSLFVACSGEKKSEASTEDATASTEIANTVTDDATTAEVTNTEVVANLAAIEFEETVHDFGTIQEGEKVEHIFKFKNTGDVPLILTAVQPSCGCTASDYTKDPVAPGAEGTISLTFDSKGKPGNVNKTATVKANIEGGQTLISFKGNVVGEQSGAPYK